MAARGEALFRQLRLQRLPRRRTQRCTRRTSRACSAGPFPSPTARSLVADERYLRDSILLPLKEVAAGYEPIMPSFAGRIGEEDILDLIAYIKSLANARSGHDERTNLARGDNDALRDPGAQRAAHPQASYLDEGHTIRSWLTTRDHKRIAILYAVAITVFFFIGGVAATLMRIELATPAGDLVSAETYNKLFTMHGVIMVWFFLIPSIPATLGNFLVPLMIGARDMAFPRLNLASWYLYVAGATFTLAALIARRRRHRLDVLRAVLHDVLQHARVLRAGRRLRRRLLVDPHRASTSSSPSTSCARPGMGWFRLPLFVWAQYATCAILVLATPVLAMTLVLLAVERYGGIGIFDPRAGRRPAAVPAPVLVLFASGRLHHGASGDGRRERDHRLLRAQSDLRLPHDGVRDRRRSR